MLIILKPRVHISSLAASSGISSGALGRSGSSAAASGKSGNEGVMAGREAQRTRPRGGEKKRRRGAVLCYADLCNNSLCSSGRRKTIFRFSRDALFARVISPRGGAQPGHVAHSERKAGRGEKGRSGASNIRGAALHYWRRGLPLILLIGRPELRSAVKASV